MGNQDSFGAAFGRLVKRKRGEMYPKWTQGDLAAALYPNQDDARETRKGDISKLENGKVANPNTNTITNIAKALDISADEIDTLQRQAQMSPAQQLDHLATLPRDALELLASRFEIPTPHRLSVPELQDALSKRAEQYRSYRALIDGLDDRVAAIANLKGAAQDAAERLDFEAVEELLSRVDTVETEITADIKQARAANALLRGKVQQAYNILTAAADSFASVDPLEPSRRRAVYGKMLYDYGKRFAVEALVLAVQMWGNAANDIDPTIDATLWAGLQNNLGNSLLNIGKYGNDTVSLERSEAAFNNALRERSQDKEPLGWAMVQNNLGNALATLGELKNDASQMKQAIAAYRNALRERTRKKVPLQWAMTQNNLGNALATLGQLEGNDTWFEQAITAYNNALCERTRGKMPVEWAMTQNNLGTALKTLGEREGDTAQLELAFAAYHNALREQPQDKVPLDWAITQLNLGGVHLAFFNITKDRTRLDKAESHVVAALEVFEPAAPRYAGMAQARLQQIAERRE